MTHKDIYTKFMIEYDKANVTSSYPSLTEYEVATVLDKAYNALIAQKVTGNNIRRVGFEGDSKAIVDIAPLIKRSTVAAHVSTQINMAQGQLPPDMLYYVSSQLTKSVPQGRPPIDNTITRPLPVKLVTHEMADKFIITPSNIPWIKTPVCFIEESYIYVVFEPLLSSSIGSKTPDTTGNGTETSLLLTYIKKPNPFVKNRDAIYNKYQSELEDHQTLAVSFFDCRVTTEIGSWKDNNNTPSDTSDDTDVAEPTGADTEYWVKTGEEEGPYQPAMEDEYNFECNDTVAEELISLAVTFALENVESQRLNSKLNMRGLEA